MANPTSTVPQAPAEVRGLERGGEAEPQTLRFVTLNLWGENGPHERRLDLVGDELGRLDADVVLLQEVREVPGRLPNQADTLARRLGFHRAFTVGTEWGGGVEGLAVVSRFPIGESDGHRLPHGTETEGRIGLSARLDTPRGPLWAHTTHLSYRLHEGVEREDQVQALHAEVAARAARTDLPQILAGDFNTIPEADEIRWLKGLTTLGGRRVCYQDAWATVWPSAPGITWARDNPFRAKMTWLPGDRRIDYVFVTAPRRDGRGSVRDARVVFDRPDLDGVYPSDHFGVLADVQIVPFAADRGNLVTYRLAHVTDPHFRSFEGARLGDFVGKRAVGALNLVVNRRRKHKMELLEAMADDLRREQPDHLALTGDLSNVSLEAEWRQALRWIEGTQRPPGAVTVIPGNHDAYVPEVVERRAFESLFAAYQSNDLANDLAPGAGAGAGAGDTTYPFVQLRGPLGLVAINSCVPTGDLGAWGQVGAAQLERVEATLRRAELRDRVRVVLIHHPPVKLKGGEERNLKDRAALAEVLARAGADLVLHGHDHHDETATLAGPAGATIPIIGAGSASYTGGPEKRARYNVYEFEGARVTRVIRVHDEATDVFREAARDVLRSS